MSFIHLHTHSEYSIVDGLSHIPTLVDYAVQQNFTAVAVTDFNNLFAAIEFYQCAVSKGIKPIIGCEISLDFSPVGRNTECSVVVLCMNQQGYQNLMQLLTLSYREVGRHGPKVRYQWLQDHNEGLIVLSGGRRGDLGLCLLESQGAKTREIIDFWKQYFPDRYYIEIFRTNRRQDDTYSDLALDVALAERLPVVASNDVCFLEERHFNAHEARVCIAKGFVLSDRSRPDTYNREQYMKTAAQMEALFSDVPQAITNTAEIAKRCTVVLEFDKIRLPEFPVPAEQSADDYLAEITQQELQNYLQANTETTTPSTDYHDRLQRELDIIKRMGYAGYFLIVEDFVGWAKREGIAVGPGRGSGSGSLVAFMLHITAIDPLQYDLLFERFLNPERVSMPDFDIDFCMDNRDRVINYVIERYGVDKVSQIITFDKMAARAVIRDIGRVQGKPYNFVDEIAKLIPRDLHITLQGALKTSPDLKERYNKDPEVTALIDASMELEGVVRNPGRHAGGIVIAPGPMTDYVPLYCETDKQNMMTQFDMNGVEKIGLVKFDFLGLRTLTLIDRALHWLGEQRGKPMKPEDIPLDDAKTYALLQSGKTIGVFQLESGGIRILLRDIEPDKFEEIVDLIALYRPGPLQSGMDKSYIQRKHGNEAVRYLHPILEPILKSTYGTIIYQEQVMEIARELAGYTLGGADLLRRAMGKKLQKEMDDQEQKFIEGAISRGVKQRIAVEIFNDIKEFAAYGFNKSHSVAYALLAYYTAWLKAHYPAAFMATAMSCEMDDKDRIEVLIYDSMDRELQVLLPDVNQSERDFSVSDDTKIRYGLGAVRHVGKQSAVEIVKERNANGPFTSLRDFCQRIVRCQVKQKEIDILVKVGALDSVGNRATMLASIEYEYKLAEQAFQDESIGQASLLGDAPESNQSKPSRANGTQSEIYSQMDLLSFERDNLGTYLSGHPVNVYSQEINKLLTLMNHDCFFSENQVRRQAKCFAGICIKVIRKSGRGGHGVIFILDDGKERREFLMFGETFNTLKGKLNTRDILFVEATKSTYRKSESWKVRSIFSLQENRTKLAKDISVVINLDSLESDLSTTMQPVIKPFLSQQGCGMRLILQEKDKRIEMKLGADWKIDPCEPLLTRLHQVCGVASVEVLYGGK